VWDGCHSSIPYLEANVARHIELRDKAIVFVGLEYQQNHQALCVTMVTGMLHVNHHSYMLTWVQALHETLDHCWQCVGAIQLVEINQPKKANYDHV